MPLVLDVSKPQAAPVAEEGVEAIGALTFALDQRTRKLESLQEELDKKSEEHEALHANYLLMHEQMLALRAAALKKLGQEEEPPVEISDEPEEETEEAAATGAPAEASDIVQPPASSDLLKQVLNRPLPQPLANALEAARQPLKALEARKDQLNEAATKARDGLARGLSDLAGRLPESLRPA